MKVRLHLFFMVIFLALGTFSHAQEDTDAIDANVDDLGNVSDDFKENFFNALREKAIGNHDRAITFLEKCATLEPTSGAVQFELAKNYLGNNAFAKAESHIQSALKLSGDKEWLLDTLFEVYDQQRDYTKALPVLEKLATINKTYEELLPSLYMRLGNNEQALKMIESLDARLGTDDKREQVKSMLLAGKAQEAAATGTIEQLKENIKKNPKEEQLYIQLIYLYSQQDDQESMLAAALELEKNVDGSDKAHLAMYKIFLANGDVRKGIKSMVKVFKSNQFDDATKVNVLQDFIETGATDPAIASEVDDAITTFSKQVDDPRAYNALGDYYLKNKKNAQAMVFFEKGLELNSNDYELVKKVALMSLDLKEYSRTAAITDRGLAIFPAQALLYLINGVAYNNLNQPDKAINTLETGLSFILDEVKIEADMYEQLAIAYDKKGNASQASKMRAESKKRSK